MRGCFSVLTIGALMTSALLSPKRPFLRDVLFGSEKPLYGIKLLSTQFFTKQQAFA
jgi:hypothetical protein